MPLAVYYARRGNIVAHRQTMQGTYLGGMIVAGGLTLIPGRLNFEILFGASDGLGGMWGSAIGIGSAILVFIALVMYDKRARSV